MIFSHSSVLSNVCDAQKSFLSKMIPLSTNNIGPANPFKPNGISHCYQFDKSISVLRVVGWYFTFLFKFQ